MNDVSQKFLGLRESAQALGNVSQPGPVLPAQKTPEGLVQFGGHNVAEDVAPAAQELVAQFPGLRAVSGHRDSLTNKRSNGVPNSWHLKGRAMDFKGPIKDLHRAAAAAEQLGATEALVHNAGDGMILHVAWGS